MTSNDTRWRSASSGSPLPEWTDFGPRSLLHYGLHPAMFSGNDSLVLVASIIKSSTLVNLMYNESKW